MAEDRYSTVPTLIFGSFPNKLEIGMVGCFCEPYFPKMGVFVVINYFDEKGIVEIIYPELRYNNFVIEIGKAIPEKELPFKNQNLSTLDQFLLSEVIVNSKFEIAGEDEKYKIYSLRKEKIQESVGVTKEMLIPFCDFYENDVDRVKTLYQQNSNGKVDF